MQTRAKCTHVEPHSKGRLLTLPVNIILGWYCLLYTDALAYNSTVQNTAVKNWTVNVQKIFCGQNVVQMLYYFSRPSYQDLIWKMFFFSQFFKLETKKFKKG
jgi:hypothetical protein